VIRVGELSELVSVAKFFLGNGAPRSRNAAVLSVSGGQAGAIADHLSGSGIAVPNVSPEAEARLDSIIELGGGFNPCDLTGAVATDHGLAARVYETFAAEPQIGTIIYARKALTGQASAAAAAALKAVVSAGSTPLAVYAMDGAVEGEEADTYERAGIPVFASVAELGASIRGLADWRAQRERIRAPHDVPARRPPRVLEATDGVVSAAAVRRLLNDYGIAVPLEEVIRDGAAAVKAAQRIGFPVVLKVASGRIPHKTEAGGVVLDLKDTGAVAQAHAQIQENAARFLGESGSVDVLVQEQVRGGAEMIVGAKIDPAFGAFVLVGTGGVMAEVLADAVLRPAPLSAAEALEMVDELRGAALLRGFRGAEEADVAALATTISRFSALVADHAETLREADLNPVLVLPAGCGVRVVDALLIVEPEAG
jgi:acyl-CoA synthetase (NDP forming)